MIVWADCMCCGAAVLCCCAAVLLCCCAAVCLHLCLCLCLWPLLLGWALVVHITETSCYVVLCCMSCKRWGSYMPLPVTAEYGQWITAQAQALIQEFPMDSFGVLRTESPVPPFNFSGTLYYYLSILRAVILLTHMRWRWDGLFIGWTIESYQLAVSSAYSQLTEGQTLSDAFVSNLQTLLRKRVAMAGYRLARVLSAARLDSAPLPPPPSDDSGNRACSPLFFNRC